VGPKAGLDTEVRGKILYLCRGLNLDRLVVQSVVRHYIDWNAPAPGILTRYLIIQGSHFVWTRCCFLLSAGEAKRAHVSSSSCPNEMLALYIDDQIRNERFKVLAAVAMFFSVMTP
jgi:hypothetical protein